MNPESGFLTLKLLETVALLETSIIFTTNNTLSPGTTEGISSQACDSYDLGCGHSDLENLQVQGCHNLNDPHSEGAN